MARYCVRVKLPPELKLFNAMLSANVWAYKHRILPAALAVSVSKVVSAITVDLLRSRRCLLLGIIPDPALEAEDGRC